MTPHDHTAALRNKRDLDRLERALGNAHPTFLYTDGLPPPPCRDPDCEKCTAAKPVDPVHCASVRKVSLQYAVRRIEQAMHDLADAASVSDTAAQFRLSDFAIRLEAIVREIVQESERVTGECGANDDWDGVDCEVRP